MTPEQIAEAVALAQSMHDGGHTQPNIPNALLAEHDQAKDESTAASFWKTQCQQHVARADTNARDAARWRAVREQMDVLFDTGGWWLEFIGNEKMPCPMNVDEAADRLIADQEARDGTA